VAERDAQCRHAAKRLQPRRMAVKVKAARHPGSDAKGPRIAWQSARRQRVAAS
jgi:hypothetical protein